MEISECSFSRTYGRPASCKQQKPEDFLSLQRLGQWKVGTESVKQILKVNKTNCMTDSKQKRIVSRQKDIPTMQCLCYFFAGSKNIRIVTKLETKHLINNKYVNLNLEHHCFSI